MLPFVVFLFEYYISMILIPFLISRLYCYDFNTFSDFDYINIYFWLNPLRVLSWGRRDAHHARGKFLEANSS